MKLQHEMLAHENYMIYLITNTILKSGDQELKHHIEQYIGSITPNTSTPWLFTENIVGVTLSSDILTKDVTTNTIKLYFETLLILDSLSKLLPGFVHGDLNPGNIFLIQRTVKHKQCNYEIISGGDDGNPSVKPITFEDRYMIKLIDFGFSECDSFKWIDHPGHPGRSIAGIWQLDAFMALDSFYQISSESDKLILKNICTDFFGSLASEMDNPEFDIYENIHLLLDTAPKEVLFDLILTSLSLKVTHIT
jgi:serine/threonine protein kinase